MGSSEPEKKELNGGKGSTPPHGLSTGKPVLSLAHEPEALKKIHMCR